MQNSLVETLVGGLVVAVAVVFLCVGYFSTSSTPRGGAVAYKAVFDSVDGITINSDVKIGGVKIGSVSAIEFDGNYRVVVTLLVRKDLKIPDDSAVAVSSSGFIGDKYIDVQPGGSPTYLGKGDTFLSAKSPLSLESLLNKAILAFARR